MQALFSGFKDSDRVWVYQSDKNLSEQQIAEIENGLSEFFHQWKSHGENVKADFKILYNRFIVLVADAADPLCGRAMDASVRFIKETGEKLQINFLNRLQIGYLENNFVKTFSLNEIPDLVHKGILKEDTFIFNNSISTKKELDSLWQVALKDSWLKMKVTTERVS